MFFVFKIRLYIQVMHKILYIKPYLEGMLIELKHPYLKYSSSQTFYLSIKDIQSFTPKFQLFIKV